MTDFPPNYTLCTTEQAVRDAIAFLKRSELLFLDCEGRELGKLGGALSLLALGTAHAERVFLFDAVALDPTAAAMAALMDLLVRNDVRKVVWDGRMDFLELRATYGLHLGGVLDLQLAEIASRTGQYKEGDREHLNRLGHVIGFREARRACFRDVQVLTGLGRCLVDCKMSDIVEKDKEVMQMHESQGSAIWMDRPLPEQLLRYAANDIRAIALLYDHFMRAGYLSAKAKRRLLGQSERYITMHAPYTRVEPASKFLLHAFLPLDILSEPSRTTNICTGCKRMLSRGHFERNRGQCCVCRAVVSRERFQEEKARKKAAAAAAAAEALSDAVPVSPSA